MQLYNVSPAARKTASKRRALLCLPPSYGAHSTGARAARPRDTGGDMAASRSMWRHGGTEAACRIPTRAQSVDRTASLEHHRTPNPDFCLCFFSNWKLEVFLEVGLDSCVVSGRGRRLACRCGWGHPSPQTHVSRLPHCNHKTTQTTTERQISSNVPMKLSAVFGTSNQQQV